MIVTAAADPPRNNNDLEPVVEEGPFLANTTESIEVDEPVVVEERLLTNATDSTESAANPPTRRTDEHFHVQGSGIEYFVSLFDEHRASVSSTGDSRGDRYSVSD